MAERAFDDDTEFGADVLLHLPVQAGVVFDAVEEFDGELAELVFLHDFTGGLVVGQGGVEGVFVLGET